VKRPIALVIVAGISCCVSVRPVAPAGRARPRDASQERARDFAGRAPREASGGQGTYIAGLVRNELFGPLTPVIARAVVARARQTVAAARARLSDLVLDGDPPPRATLLARLGTLSDELTVEQMRGYVSAQTVTALRELRLAYHARCAGACTRDAIFTELTKQLVTAYASHGDAASAMAERKLLAALRPTW
jgi:hypothetical protein